jgi:hypothetical protein
VDTEKIRNYNTRFLAFIYTIVAVGTFIYFILALGDLDNGSSDRGERESEPEPVEVTKPQTSFSSPILVDSINQIYLYQIGNNAREGEWEGVPPPSDSFLNLLLHDYKTQTSRKILDKPFSGSHLNIWNDDAGTLISFQGASKDSNKDGQITGEDLNDFYVCDLEEKNTRILTWKNAGFLNALQVNGGRDMLLSFGEDSNRDGILNLDVEPILAFRYDYQKDKLFQIGGASLLSEVDRLNKK